MKLSLMDWLRELKEFIRFNKVKSLSMDVDFEDINDTIRAYKDINKELNEYNKLLYEIKIFVPGSLKSKDLKSKAKDIYGGVWDEYLINSDPKLLRKFITECLRSEGI